MATLPTNFKDDILDTSVNTRRRYRVYENTDGTIELEDVTEYSQVGDEFGAGQINATNREVNKKFDKNMIVRNLNTINAITKEGYVPDALALKEVNDSLQSLSNETWELLLETSVTTATTFDVDLTPYKKICLAVGHAVNKSRIMSPSCIPLDIFKTCSDKNNYFGCSVGSNSALAWYESDKKVGAYVTISSIVARIYGIK